MRTVPAGIASALANEIQTRANSANPSASIWVNRPTTALTDNTFLERQTVLGVGASDTSIAVCHPHFGGENTEIYMGFISNGTASVIKSRVRTRMSAHTWFATDFTDEGALSISLAFDGTMPKNPTNTYEFITESSPWVFWVNGLGALFARKLDSEDVVVLAEQNCTKVSAVRAMWSEIPEFDFGLVVFFLMNDTLYYRQLIGGVWYDAEVVPAAYLPVDTITDIRASRTWDYRVTLMLKAGTKLYYVATQFGGLGSKSAEHIEVHNVIPRGAMTQVHYRSASNGNEHIELSDISAGAPYGGLYSTAVPSIVSVRNEANEVEVDGETTTDYGRRIVVVFDVHLVASEVTAQPTAFDMRDSNDTRFVAASAELASDGLSVILTMPNFNNAYGQCTIKYTPGTITSMGGTALEAKTCVFTPTGLVPVFLPLPEVVEVTNI